MSLLAVIPHGALFLDQDLRILEINPAFLDLLGYTGDSPTPGTPFLHLLTAPDARRLPSLLTQQGESITEILTLINARGEPLSLPVTLAPYRMNDHAPDRWLVTVAPHPPESAMDRTTSGSSRILWELDTSTGLVRLSGTIAHLPLPDPEFPIPFDQALRFIHPRDREHVLLGLRQITRSLRPGHRNFRILHPGCAGGRAQWIQASAQIRFTETGQGLLLSGTLLETTPDSAQDQANCSEIVTAAQDGMAFLDQSGCVRAINPALLAFLERRLAQTLGQPFARAFGAQHPLTGLLRHFLAPGLRAIKDNLGYLQMPDDNGQSREYEVKLLPARGSPVPQGLTLYLREVTHLRQLQQRLQQFSVVYANTSNGVMITDAAGTILAINPACTRITGFAEHEVLREKPNLLNSQWHPKSFFVSMWRELRRTGTWQGEVWNRRKDGEIYLQRLSIHRITAPGGLVTHYIGIFAEQNAAQMHLRRNEYLTHYDPLTKLPNRLLFEARLEHAIDLGERKDAPLAVFLVDLDRFSHINTSLGHNIGDELLCEIGLRLRSEIRPADTLARLTGDRFGLIFEDIKRPEDVVSIAQRIRKTLGKALVLRGHEVFVTASIGIAYASASGSNREVMLAHADTALRQIKQEGRNGFLVHANQNTDAVQECQRLIGILRTGLEKGEFLLHFQPRLDINTDAWVGAEAFVRWQQPHSEAISPDRIFSLSEDSTFVVELGQWALTQICRQLQDWRARDIRPGPIAFKVEEPLLRRFDLVRTVQRLLHDYRIDGPQLNLEFSAALLLRHGEQIIDIFSQLQHQGVRLTLRDVGAGWITFPLLRRLPIQLLRIHPDFIESLPESRDDCDVVEALISISQSMDMDIMADGVRTNEQRIPLMNMGCHQAQGSLFFDPLAPEIFEQRLIEQKRPDKPTRKITSGSEH